MLTGAPTASDVVLLESCLDAKARLLFKLSEAKSYDMLETDI